MFQQIPVWALFLISVLVVSVDARPFVLLSGVESLPDDDLALPPVADTGSVAFSRVPVRIEQHRPVLSILSRRKINATPAPVKPAAVAQRVASIREVQAVKCHNARHEVMIKSGLQGYSEVFSRGQTAPAWTSAASSAVELPAEEGAVVFAVQTGPGTILSDPQVIVSDPTVAAVEILEKPGVAYGEPVVLRSDHTCKRSGTVKITLALPLQQDHHAGVPVCAGTLDPVVFTYQKICSPASHALDTAFTAALTAKLPEREKLLSLSGAVAAEEETEKPWSGIIPTGGARTVLIMMTLFILFIVLYEFGNHWLSNHIKHSITEMAPDMFGCRCTIEHCVLSLTPWSFSYEMRGLNFANPDDGGSYQNEFFMHIEDVKVWLNLRKLFLTCGREIEITQLSVFDIRVNVERDGYFSGPNNIDKVLAQLEERQKKWQATLAELSNTHGVDAVRIWKDVEAWIQKQMERVTLKEASMKSIGYSVSNKAIGMEMTIKDMEFHDFSEQYQAIGVHDIGFHLVHEILDGITSGIAGVEFGKQQYTSIVDSLKSLTGR